MDTQKENPDKLPENSTDKDQLAVADDVPLSGNLLLLMLLMKSRKWLRWS